MKTFVLRFAGAVVQVILGIIVGIIVILIVVWSFGINPLLGLGALVLILSLVFTFIDYLTS